MNLNMFNKALELLSSDVDADIQLQTVRVLLFVAIRGSCTQKDVEIELQTNNASTSRNVSYWTDRRFDKKPGMGFIIRVEDANDRRFKVLTLTKKGQAFIEKLKGV
jgi:DNA-binding MarR family transcriptional regulator